MPKTPIAAALARRLRYELGLSVPAIAAIIEVPAPTVYKWVS